MGSGRQEATLLRALYFNRTGILLLIMILASVAMVGTSARVHNTAKEFWLSLGVAVLAASVYTFFQVLLTARQFDTFLTNTVRSVVVEQVEQKSGEVLAEYRALQKVYIPTAIFARSMMPGREFNRQLNQSITNSGHYTFYGVTARFAVSRLSSLSTVPNDIKLIMANPSLAATVDSRARRDARTGDEKSFAEARQKLLDGVYMSIAGAYVHRHRFNRIELCFTNYPPIDRAELCDDGVYFARFSDTQDVDFLFPTSMKFDRSALIYQMLDHECNRISSSPFSVKVLIQSDQSERDFLAQLSDVKIPVTPDNWERMKDNFAKFREAHRGELLP